jgi:hypothetical protein
MRTGRIVLWFALLMAAVASAAIVRNRLASDDPSCSRASDAERPLDLRTPADRSHLQQDLAAIDAAALEFRSAVAERPLLSDSVDAVEGARTAPERAQHWCRETLRSALLEIHHLKQSDLRAPN